MRRIGLAGACFAWIYALFHHFVFCVRESQPPREPNVHPSRDRPTAQAISRSSRQMIRTRASSADTASPKIARFTPMCGTNSSSSPT